MGIVFPMLVGVFLYPPTISASTTSLPHARGGVSEQKMINRLHYQSSPCSWGCFLTSKTKLFLKLVFPMLVGVFLCSIATSGSCRGLPHARGGVSWLSEKILSLRSSSPCSWGCFYCRRTRGGRESVFPMLVGVFPSVLRVISW